MQKVELLDRVCTKLHSAASTVKTAATDAKDYSSSETAEMDRS